ncbi:Mov34/MPN/PAD-1 family protein [Deinococcus sp. QL22]|uniref:Mov34/MPN/PAD-1 family protein n=1 Tax=Deinococcus sp. QL22 TaxID=2939437 RepID=UPI0035302A5E
MSAAQVRTLLRLCTAALPNETGGILAGHYTARHEMAHVRAVLPAPADSLIGRSTFERGTTGTRAWLDQLWRERGLYYLGEWHSHPHASPDPSPQDRQTMRNKSLIQAYACPEPLLLIIGGDPQGQWQAATWVFPQWEPNVELMREERTSARPTEETA